MRSKYERMEHLRRYVNFLAHQIACLKLDPWPGEVRQQQADMLIRTELSAHRQLVAIADEIGVPLVYCRDTIVVPGGHDEYEHGTWWKKHVLSRAIDLTPYMNGGLYERAREQYDRTGIPF